MSVAAMKNVQINTIRAESATGYYYKPPVEVKNFDIHPVLRETLNGITQFENWRIFKTEIYDMVSRGPLGYLELAIHSSTHRACGYFAQFGFQRPMSEPMWFHCSGSVHNVTETFYQIVLKKGWLEFPLPDWLSGVTDTPQS